MQKRVRHIYTNEQIEYLREIAPISTNDELVILFNERFNLKQTKSALNAVRFKNKIQVGVRSTGGQFEKGTVPWNKGKTGYMSSNKTSFKKGQMPYNYRPVGSERVTVEGYIEIKVADPKTWKLKQRVIWESHYGEIPSGCTIVFADRNNRNFDIDNLICVSRRELLSLNQNRMIYPNSELTKTCLNVVKLENRMTDITNMQL